MSSILKVDTIQNTAGAAPTATDLGLNTAGSVLQVQQGVMTSRQTVTGGSMVDVGGGFEVTITPASTSSKILVQTILNKY